ncbi:unnamed protein product [Ixodes hexagonus]
MAATAVVAGRQKQLKKLQSFVDKTEKQLDSILGSLKWTKERILEKKGYVVCPFDPGHKMPASSLNKHLELCSWLKEGYTRAEKEEAPPSSHFFYTNSTSVVPVLIDRETQQKVITEAAFRGEVAAEACQKVKNVPLTMARCIVELSPAERFAIYDYTVERAKAANKTPSIKLEDLQINFEKKTNGNEYEERPPSHLEIKSKMRDYKRRRQSYRAKNVHITRKSYTEVLREVIENQTDYLKHMLKEDDESIAVSTRVSGSSGTESQAPPSSVREQREASVASSKRKRSVTPEPRKTDREKTYSLSDTSSRHRQVTRIWPYHRKHRHHHHKSKHKHKHKSKGNEDSED